MKSCTIFFTHKVDMLMKISIQIFLTFFFLSSCSTASFNKQEKLIGQGNLFQKGMVAAAHPLAVDAGLEILREGGSAADAAIAVQSTLSLVEPQSSGLGGGAFMLYYDAKTKMTTVYDGREKAPSALPPFPFLDSQGKKKSFPQARRSGLSVGVPGVMSLLAEAHKDHGNLPWRRGFQPALHVAQEGFLVTPRLHRLIKRYLEPQNTLKSKEVAAWLLSPEGKAWPVGHRLKNPAYARALRLFSQNPGAFYAAPFSEILIKATAAPPEGGVLTSQDLKNYEALKKSPLCRAYRGYKICSAPPPASGGVILNEMLGLLEGFDMPSYGPENAEGWHYFIEASRLAYADRDAYVADPAFVEVPVQTLLSQTYLDKRRKLIQKNRAQKHVEAGKIDGFGPFCDMTREPSGTTHFVITDGEGNTVSMTASIESVFGSRRMAMGILLNNQLTDFSFESSYKNGCMIANASAPDKRPRSSMSPVIVFDKKGEFVLAVGSPGGNSIPAYVLKVLIGVLDWSLPLQKALDLPNIVARGSVTRLEKGNFSPLLIRKLENMGHIIDSTKGENSGLHAIRRHKNGLLEGAADFRREGKAESIALSP